MSEARMRYSQRIQSHGRRIAKRTLQQRHSNSVAPGTDAIHAGGLSAAGDEKLVRDE